MKLIHQIANVSANGKITLPKAVRDALGVGAGRKVAFDFDGTAVVVSRVTSTEHSDVAIARFLALIEQDIAMGKNVGSLPAHLARSLESILPTNLHQTAEIEGDVNL